MDVQSAGPGFPELAPKVAKAMQAAAVAAVTDAAVLAKAGGRASIAAGGFSVRWQNALRHRVYPNADKPLTPAAIVWHKIQYSNIFETGGTVSGKPSLWLPLPEVPRGAGSHPLTPAQYVARVGPLRTIKVPGKPPMLAGRGSRAGITRATATQVRVRKRAVKAGTILGAWVPLFIAKKNVTDPQRFNIRGAARKAAEDLPELYERRLEKVT